MLSPVIAHAGQPPAPHDLWGAWNLDPVLLVGLALAVWAYRRGTARGGRSEASRRKVRSFAAGVGAIGVALVSPLDALSSALASAHMVQHLLLVLVAAPLLALGAPSTTVVRGLPRGVQRSGNRWGRRLRLTRFTRWFLHRPVAAWLLHVATLWTWHAAVPYGAALDSEIVHLLEHASFLLTGVLFWWLVIGARRTARASKGFGVLLVFGMALQSTFLSVLLTFSETAWYPGYADTTAAWGLSPLADQQLAGVIMWIPAGFVYLAIGLALLAAWMGEQPREDAVSAVEPSAPTP